MIRDSFLPYFKPEIDDDDIAAVTEAMRNGWLTTGPKVREFEAAFAQRANARHAIALNSCTAGLHLGMLALGIRPGDEVVMPSLTFVAGAHCAKQLGAVPIFADVEESSLCISVCTIDAVVTERTRLIIPMHYAGYPAHIAEIVAYANARGIAVLEDAAHAVGMLDEGRCPGVVSSGAAYSFYATKNIASAEGGMFVTNDDDLAERVRILSLHGMDRDAWKRYTAGGTWRYDVPELGYKDNMPDICAALGTSQLRKLDVMQRRRDTIAARYTATINALPGIQAVIPQLRPGDRHSWCMYVIRVQPQAAGVNRDTLIEELRRANIGTSVHYIPSHHFSYYRGSAPEGALPVTDRLASEIMSLPLYPAMHDDDVEYVIESVADIVSEHVERRIDLQHRNLVKSG